MRRNNNLLKITAAFTIFALGASLLIHHNVSATEVNAVQHASNYGVYTYSGDYYDDIIFNSSTGGLNGTLREDLTSKICPTQWHKYSGTTETALTYHLPESDEDPNNPNNMVYFYTRDSVTKNPATTWNREHVWPQSLSNGNWDGSGKDNYAGADILHIRPTYQSTNSSRGNTKFGEVSNGETKKYNNMLWGYMANGYFEPIDSNKGDVARIIMYVWTAYYGFSGYSSNDIADVFDSYNTLLKWHTEDKPDMLEGKRNNYAYEDSLQHNRNPFVDHPEYAWKIFGDNVTNTSILNACKAAYPASGFNPDPITVTGISVSPTSLQLVPGGNSQLVATITPDEAYATVTWSSSNETVATVSQSGVVTISSSASAGASVTITASCGGFSASCTVTVKAASQDQQQTYSLYTGDITEGDYLIYYDGKIAKAEVSSNNRLNYAAVTPSNNQITTVTAEYVWHIAKSGNYYTLYNASTGKYAAGTGTKNQAGLITDGTDNKALWTVTNTNGTYEFVNKHNSANNVNSNLRNNGTYGFACYSSSTGGPLSLYKQDESSGPTAKEQINELSTRSALTYGYTKNGSENTVSDTLNRSSTGVTGTTYTAWSNVQGDSGAKYAGQSAGGNSAIQLRATNPSGIVTTTSGGTVAKISVVWESHTLSGRKLDVYGQNYSYSSAADLYSTSTQGTKIGTIENGKGNELVISGNYEYIGVKSNDGALYLTSITIEWGEPATFDYSGVAINFGGFISQTLWNELDGNEHNIKGYGVIAAYTEQLNGSTIKTKYDNAFNSSHNVMTALANTCANSSNRIRYFDTTLANVGSTPAEANISQKSEMGAGPNDICYIWSLRRSTPSYTTPFSAIAYIRLENELVFFKETSKTAKQAAVDAISFYGEGSFDGSLSYFLGL